MRRCRDFRCGDSGAVDVRLLRTRRATRVSSLEAQRTLNAGGPGGRVAARVVKRTSFRKWYETVFVTAAVTIVLLIGPSRRASSREPCAPIATGRRPCGVWWRVICTAPGGAWASNTSPSPEHLRRHRFRLADRPRRPGGLDRRAVVPIGNHETTRPGVWPDR